MYIDGEIVTDEWEDSDTSAAGFRDALKSLGDVKEINLHINSPGGSVFEGIAIYNMLKQHKAKVNIYVDALAASIASVIAMSGDAIFMPSNSMMMIHNPATIAIGDSEEMKKAVKMLDEVKESIMNAYEIKTDLARDKISKLMDAESWLNAKKAVELGFADKILFADGQGDVTDDAGEGMAVSDEMSAPVMFSRQAVMNSMLSKLIPPKKPVEKRTPVDQLEKRLRLLSH